MIRLLQPSVTEEEIAAVTDVLRSKWWGNGPKCKEFEHRLEKYYAYDYCVTVNSATAALHLSLLANGIGPGDEVIVPALTFVSTAAVVKYCGATPVFADVQPDSLCINWDDVYEKRTKRTKAIIPVDFAGFPSLANLELPDETIIQDAAHSCGGIAYGQFVNFSFHPVKPIATGDGGAILTNDQEAYKEITESRWFGISKDTYTRTTKRYNWDYDIQKLGYKYHWNDLQASIGLVQLDRMEEMQARRRSIANAYTSALCTLVETPMDHVAHTWHLYIIRVPRRDAFIQKMGELGVEVGVHYKPLYYYNPFSLDCPPTVTENEWGRLASLPLHCNLTDCEVDQVIEAVKRCL